MKRFLSMILVTLLVLSCTSAMAEWMYATDGDTNIRVKTDVNSDSLGVFKKGEKIWVYEHIYTPDGRNWCVVNFLGQHAFISDRYCSYEVAYPENYVDVNRNRYNYDEYYDEYDDYEFEYEKEFDFVVIYDCNVFDWVENGEFVGILNRGQVVQGSMVYTSENGQAWLQVAWMNGEYAYVPVQNLKLIEPLIDGHYPVLSKYMVVTGGRVNVHEDADIDSEDVGTIHKGDVIIVDFFVCVNDGERRMWGHAYGEDGEYLGFVSTKYLTAVIG